jgi:peptide/nickel transport system substrate-binding protein
MGKKLGLTLLMMLILTLALAACGDNTATPASSGTTAASSNTTAAANATTAAANATTAAAAKTTLAAAAASTPLPTLPPQQVAAGPGDSGVAATPALAAIPADAKKGGTLTVAVPGSLPTSLHPNPTNADYGVATYRSVAQLIWNQALMDYNYTTLQWQLEMAKDLKVDSTGKIFTFTLRPDLKWSDGSPITVDDFQFTFDNTSKENKENPAANYVALDNKRRIASFKTDAASNTITITTNDTYARDLALNFINTYPMPKKVWDGKPFYDPANNPEIKKPTVVNGPYMIDSYDPNGQGVFVQNPNWFRGKANFDKVIVKAFAPNLIYDAIKTGQADVSLQEMPPAQFSEVAANNDLKTYEWYGVQNQYRYIVYNTTKPPFNDKALRQAIAYSLDRSAMIKLAENGRAIPQYTFQNELSPWFNQDISRYDINLDKAKKLLDDGGYKMDGATRLGKDGQPLKFTLGYDSSSDPQAKLIVTYIQAQLKPLGIDVTVEGKDSQSYLIGLVSKKYDAGVGFAGGGNFPDPDDAKIYYISKGVYNVAGYALPRLDEIFESASHELDTAKRKQLYGEAMKILTEDLPSQVFYTKVYYIAANKKVGGIVPSKGGRIDLNQAIASWYFTS